MKASKDTGAFSAEMMSKCSEYWTGLTSTSTTCVVGANQTRPVFDGTGSTPPCPKKNGCSTSTPSCPASIAAQPDSPSSPSPPTIAKMLPIGPFIAPSSACVPIDGSDGVVDWLQSRLRSSGRFTLRSAHDQSQTEAGQENEDRQGLQKTMRYRPAVAANGCSG